MTCTTLPTTLLFTASLVALVAACSDGEAPLVQDTASLTTLRDFGSNPGALLAYRYVPAHVAPRAPLVVALHGCTQTAADYGAAGWNALAEQWGFYVLYPEQQTANNRNRCFNWFEAADIARGQGEALSIRQMIDAMRAAHDIDPQRIYVTGLSAGGAMTTVMLATYPDVFAAGAIMAGLPYRCGTGVAEAFMCMNPGVDRTPSVWADRVRAQRTGFTGPYPRVSLWTGTRDSTVAPANVTELMQQWTALHGIDDRADRTSTVEGAEHTEHRRNDGVVVVETWHIPGMGHGTAVKPGDTRAAGCGRAGAYILDAGICSTYHAARFFGLEPPSVVAPDGGTPDRPVVDRPTAADVPAVSDVVVVDRADTSIRTCQEYDDSNWNHVMAGRAMRCGVGGSYVCATGSGTQFGLWTLTRSWLREVRPNYFEPGRCL